MASEKEIVGSPKHEGFDERAVAEYWTEERQKAAKPVPFPKVKESGHPAALPKAVGEPGATAHGHGSEANPATHAEPHAGGGHNVAAPLNYPYRTCGKIFFNQGSGGFAGSACMVAPNVLLTAGHCVFENGVWSTNMAFFPSYGKRASNDPMYRIPCGRLGAWTTWTQHGDRAHDYALVWMGSNPGNVIGWLGLMWNAGTAGRVWDAVGYPAAPNPPFNGNNMCEALGTVASSGTAGTIGLTNDNMEQGSSGGPWITTFNEVNRTHANGVQSFHNHDGDTTEFGPYFTPDIQTLFTWISNPANH